MDCLMFNPAGFFLDTEGVLSDGNDDDVEVDDDSDNAGMALLSDASGLAFESWKPDMASRWSCGSLRRLEV